MRQVQTRLGPFYGWDQDDVTRTLDRGEIWDSWLLEILDRYTEAHPRDGLWHPCTALDLGANIGVTAAMLARQFRSVIAVEAHPETHRLLAANSWMQGLADRVTPVHGAAYDRLTTLRLAGAEIHGWTGDLTQLDTLEHAAGLVFVEDGLPGLEVPTVVMDLELSIDDQPIGLIKVDVQGAALRALTGCCLLIDRWRPWIVFEFEPAASECRGDSWSQYEAFFQTINYTLSPIAESPFQDFLAIPAEEHR